MAEANVQHPMPNVQHPLLNVPPPPPPLPPSPTYTSTTLFWCTISMAANLTLMTSLYSMECFKALTEPETITITILTSIITTTAHLYFFRNLHHIPTLNPVDLLKVNAVINLGSFPFYILLLFPRENSVAVAVFFVALAIDVLAVIKLVKPRKWKEKKDDMLFDRLIRVATSRVVLALGGWSVLGWSVVGCLWGLLFYYEITERCYEMIIWKKLKFRIARNE